MKVTIRTVRGDPFEVEVEASDTVASVKEKIEVAKSEENYAKASQVLVFKGQILKDESTLGALDIKEKDFLVVTMMKKAAPKPSVQDVKPPEPVAVEQKAPEQQQAAATTATLGDQAGASTSDPQSYSSAASALARGAELEAAINQICEMGFEVEQWPDFGCEGIKVQRAHQPTSQCQGKKNMQPIIRQYYSMQK
eukprot:TRINITY_DN582_c0_g2_i17.p4 TRINITY_DN582_c0_g2~~TRINITY_DN582_c0_g2_i17.p4  ORF type:complete len:195 (+),score=56.39 TRINITY_DN582_c0_g2_i17:130-714(+)